MENTHLGHTNEYWLELNKTARTLDVEKLLEEVVELRGQLDFVKNRLKQIGCVINR